MTLTYWVCECLHDAQAYNIRTKTRREAVEERKFRGEKQFSAPYKVSVTYTGAFDLLCQCLSEGGAWWENE